MGNPTRRASDRKQHGKHLGWDAHGLENNAGVKIDIGIELSLNKVRIFERNLFQASGYLQQWIIGNAEFSQDFITGLLHDRGARVVVLVDPMAKAHQAERIVLVFGALDEVIDIGFVANFFQHR